MKALTVKALVALLRKTAAGSTITEAHVKADIKAGAPADRRGRIRLDHYTAWLLRQHGYPGKGGVASRPMDGGKK